MEQFSKFCRTLLPADPFQAMLLLGVVLISFSRQLGWYSRPLVFKYTQSTNAMHRFESFMIFAVLLTVFAGCAGYFVCFWPGKHPARRTIVTVLLPAFAGLVFRFCDICMSELIGLLSTSGGSVLLSFRMSPCAIPGWRPLD